MEIACTLPSLAAKFNFPMAKNNPGRSERDTFFWQLSEKMNGALIAR